MSAAAEDKPPEEKSSSGKLTKGDDAEEDVPDDFFDDFSNNDFMAGLDVVDAWEDGLNIGPNQDDAKAKEEEDVEKAPSDDAAVQKAESEKVIVKSEIKNSDERNETKATTKDNGQKVSATDSNRANNLESTCARENPTNISKSTSDNTKPIESNLRSIENTDNSSEDPDASSSASTDSDVKNPKLDLKDVKLNSECKVIIECDLKSLTKEKIKELSVNINKNESKDHKETRKEADKDISAGPKDVNDGKEVKVASNDVKSVGDQRRHSRISDHSAAIRRDPDKTRRDIQRNKERLSKEINAKYLDQKLRLVETGLVPPGTEMDVDLHKEQDDSRKICDLRCKLRGGDRKDRARSNRSNSHDRPLNHQQSSTKRRHGDPTKSAHSSKRAKDKPQHNTCAERLSLSPSPDRQIRNIANKPNLLERRGRYNVTIGEYEQQRSPERRLPLSDREHSGSSSRRTLTIAEEMVRCLAANDGSVPSGGGMGKGERIPRRVGGRVSRSRSRSYEKYRAYKRSPSPTMKGYGSGTISAGGRGKCVSGNGGGGKRERSRSPPKRERRERDYKARDRDRRMSRELELAQGGSGRDRRERSTSPSQQQQQRKKAPTFLEELNEKLSRQQSSNPSNERRTFLEEIREKINRTQPPPPPGFQQYRALPMALAPVPAPVPPPQLFHQQIAPSPVVYDRSFFIGETIAPGAVAAQQHVLPPQMMSPIGQQTLRLLPERTIIQQTSAQVMQQASVPELSLQYHQQQQQQQMLDKESIAQLFNDKQITLTDFLSITSKVAGSDRPVDLANKIKVISRCQDAVKAMSKDCKVTGRFFMRKRLAHQRPHNDQPNNKLISPLKRSPAVRFRFTSKAPVNDDMVYRTSVQLLLHNLGLPDGTEPLRDPTPEPEDVHQQLRDTPRALIVCEGNNLKSIVPTDGPIIIAAAPKKEVLQKMCQTDPVNLCRECNARAKKQFVSVGCQYDDERMFVCVGTQVNGTEDTFTPARANLQGLLKSRSLASLTPAQILAQVAATAKTATPTKVTEPPPRRDDLPFKSPELKRRVDLSTNWNQSINDRSMTLTSNRRLDTFNYNEQQQERHLQQQLQMTMDMQQKNRPMQMNARDPNRFPGNSSGVFPSATNSGGTMPNNSPAMFPGHVYPNNAAGHFGAAPHSGFGSGMSGNQQFGSNNAGNFGGNRFYN